MIWYSDAHAVSIYRTSGFGSGVRWIDWEKEMCQLYRKSEQTVGHQSYTEGQGQFEPKGQHFMWQMVMKSNILLPTHSLCNYFIFFGHRIPESANSVAPVFCQAIPVRIHTALTHHLYNRHINFSQSQRNITHLKSLALCPWIYGVVTQWVTEIHILQFQSHKTDTMYWQKQLN